MHCEVTSFEDERHFGRRIAVVRHREVSVANQRPIVMLEVVILVDCLQNRLEHALI
jgi:hypothetical protein